MALTPLEIHNKEFKKTMRGYDQDEVNEFLEDIIRDYELLIRENKDAKASLEEANKKLAEFEKKQESLNKSILVAQDAADRLRESTDKEIESIKHEAESYAQEVRQEADDYYVEISKKADVYADKIHTEAEKNADVLLSEAVNKARKIEEETAALRKQSRVFRQRLQLLIEAQLDLLTKEDWGNLLDGQPIEYPNTETIAKVEKELAEKAEVEAVDAEVVDEETAYDEAEDNAYEEQEEFAIADEEVYTNEGSKNEQVEKADEVVYEEGSMPAVELPNSANS